MTSVARRDTSPVPEPSPEAAQDRVLEAIAQRVRWLATAIVDAANRGRHDETGVKIGGHIASSASIVDIMVSLYFAELTSTDRVAVKPHASPVLHAINYLLGDLDASYLTALRQKGGLQSYPSRLKDPDTVDFSTGSVGIGATATVWAAMAHRYLADRAPGIPPRGRYISLLGDAELDEGAIWEAIADPTVGRLGELLWIVDLNRQSLDRVVPDIQIDRLRGMFEAAGWQVIVLKWGRRVTAVFDRPGGDALRQRLESMPNEEYQRMLRAPAGEVATRLLGDDAGDELREIVGGLSTSELGAIVRDLGGHDIGLLRAAYREIDEDRPTVIFAYTIKGRGLPTEGHPNNHSVLLNAAQMEQLAAASGTSLEAPWAPFDAESEEARACREAAAWLHRDPVPPAPRVDVPVSLPYRYAPTISTQAALGRFLRDLHHAAPRTAEMVVTCSPDVASSTNLGGWINLTGVWAPAERRDWFADDRQRLLRWSEGRHGQHIELGIAEVNLMGLLAELGSTWSRWGRRLIPIGTLYDPFIARALEPWSNGMYAGGQAIVIGTPSGVTLAAEGGAHQSITTPSIALEQPGCVAFEPAFAKDLEWCLLAAIAQVGTPEGTSAYFRLSTLPVEQAMSALPEDDLLLDRRRRQVIAGGYRIPSGAAGRPGDDPDDVTLVGVGAIMGEVITAGRWLRSNGVRAGVVCLTSPDLVFRAMNGHGSPLPGGQPDIVESLFPASDRAPLVTVLDGHPHTLAFLAGARGDRCRNLGVTTFGQSSTVRDAWALHGIDWRSIANTALDLIG